ncbi:MAG: 30S ribosomal protein S1 [Parcubacteria group bacterium]|nr:30S ribosomal protein S1 [Parcubacteria group bacterium]
MKHKPWNPNPPTIQDTSFKFYAINFTTFDFFLQPRYTHMTIMSNKVNTLTNVGNPELDGADFIDTENSIESLDKSDKLKSMKDILSKFKIQLPKPGEYLDGSIINTSRSSVLVDLGPLGTGIVYPGEFYENPELHKSLKPGMPVKVVVIELENEDGYRELSLRLAQRSSAWFQIRQMLEKGDLVTTKIINLNKGGLVVDVQGVQGFIPLSQLNEEHYPKIDGGDTTKIIQALQKYRNQEFTLKIIDVDESQNKLILSEKAILNSVAPQEIISKYSTGDVVEVEIVQVTDFGVFVKLPDESDGLVHISELTWRTINDPNEIVKIGEKVKAKIISIDSRKILLSLKVLKDNPWEKIDGKYQVGQQIEGTIVKFDIYGVRIELEPGIIALVPTSEFSTKSSMERLKMGEKSNFAIVEFEPQDQKIILTPITK